MDVSDLLTETYDRLPDLVRAAVDGLTPEQLRRAPGDGANSIGWLVWHLTRVQDHHVADLLDAEQVWVERRLGGAVRARRRPGRHRLRPLARAGRGGAAGERAGARSTTTRRSPRVPDRCVAGLRPADLDRVVDEAWDPPVTLGVRLVSIADDDLQHAGQANYVRGLIEAD